MAAPILTGMGKQLIDELSDADTAEIVALPHRELATTAVDPLLGGPPSDGEVRVPMPLRLRDSIGAPAGQDGGRREG